MEKEKSPLKKRKEGGSLSINRSRIKGRESSVILVYNSAGQRKGLREQQKRDVKSAKGAEIHRGIRSSAPKRGKTREPVMEKKAR